jgi:hypothetical protein
VRIEEGEVLYNHSDGSLVREVPGEVIFIPEDAWLYRLDSGTGTLEDYAQYSEMKRKIFGSVVERILAQPNPLTFYHISDNGEVLYVDLPKGIKYVQPIFKSDNSKEKPSWWGG